MIRGEALAQEAGQGASSQASLKAAARLFSTVAPQDPLYPDALIDLGALSLETSAFAPSAGYYQRAVEVARASARSEGDLLLANAGLALALKNLGDFRGAAEAFENGTKIALRTYGRDSHSYWAIASDWAKYRYERGDRHGAFAAFESLLQDLPAGLAVFRNASDALEGSQVLRKYGRCLANDGQGARAIELLEQAHSLLKTATVHTSDAVHFQFDLARAYDSGGRTDEARAAFMAALDEMEKRKFPASQLAGAHERWARFLLSQGDSNAAYSQFTEVLRLAHGQLGEPAILAQAGLAAIAVARGDPQGALLASGRAMSQLPHIEGYFDIRTEPYVWAIRASSLLLAGDPGSARALASHARAATADYYDPGSAQFREAEVLLQRIESTAALR
jgi:tetratricopeptide (TPR) repeat protein